MTTPAGEITPELLSTSSWRDGLVADAGIPIVDVPLVSVGGGIGSFVLTDVLRIAGVAASSIRVLGINEYPWQNYQYLTTVSQIPDGERIRSDSASTPDNIWGFPSYAVREALAARSVRGFIAPLFQVATEPIFTDYYTPKVDHVFRSMAREADRIGYYDVLDRGQVRMVRRREGGGYFTVLTPNDGSSGRVAYRSRWVHLAVGYPGLRFLPDLQTYRERYDDHHQVVNAYEPHEFVYDDLVREPGTVILRGGGIVASRVLQRLIDDRDLHGARTRIVHLFRTYYAGKHGPHFARRRGGDGWAYQGFNWPKGSWGGQQKHRLEQLEGDERKAFYDSMGGTTTPYRRLWQEQLKRGRREGFYSTVVGEVDDVRPAARGVVTRVKTNDGLQEIAADYVIDATGLEADIGEHRVLADLLEHGGAGRNPMGRLDVERTFELRGTRSGDGRAYASGATTLGGYFAGVDTFLGLQYAAIRIVDDLAEQGFARRIGPVRSVAQWWRWARNRSTDR